MASFIEDRELVKNMLHRFNELMFDESTLQQYDLRLQPDIIDPATLFAVMLEIEGVHASTVLTENGIDPEVLQGGRLPGLVWQRYAHDKEILKLLYRLEPYGAKIRPGNLKVGDNRPDIDLLQVETREKIPLSELHVNKDRPLVIIAGSFS
ncbi:uncharacterized protein [Ptychodera flava]|uniref:uncharacterized protein n=1 Tax=Ptychodera flava TaxID=63121 RepID=UPI003969E797